MKLNKIITIDTVNGKFVDVDVQIAQGYQASTKAFENQLEHFEEMYHHASKHDYGEFWNTMFGIPECSGARQSGRIDISATGDIRIRMVRLEEFDI